MSTSTNDATKPQFKTIRKVLNPSTGRYITVGSRKYKELVSSGFLNEHIESENDTIYEGEDAQKVKSKMKVPIPENKHLVARGGKIRTRNNRISKQQYAQRCRDIALEIYKENREDCDSMSQKELSAFIQDEIDVRLVSPNINQTKQQLDQKFFVSDAPIYEEEDYESDNEYYESE